MTKSKFPLKLNIQFFAEETPPADQEQNPPGDNPPADTKKEEKPKESADPKSFTEDQVEKMIKDRVARAEKDKEKAIEEAAKLAKMNADEKQKYEMEKLQKENAELKAAQNRYSLGREATKMLAESSIIADEDTLEFVVREDAEATKAAVTKFAALVEAKVDAAVKDKLKGTPPKKSTASGAVTKTEILAIKDSSARIKAIQENPQLFNQ